MDTLKRTAIVFALAAITLAFLAKSNFLTTKSSVDGLAPKAPQIEVDNPFTDQPLTMRELLDLAEASLQQVSKDVAGYTARFEKLETIATGETSELAEMQIKVQTRFREGLTNAPRRIYIRFTQPESIKGREVIWREDKYDQKMAVHETGFLLGLKTIWLDPSGLIAMQGQRHPVSELGIVKLTEQLISRGKKDIDNPNLTITVRDNYEFDGQPAKLVTVLRQQPAVEPGDYQKAEIVFDSANNLVLAFRSYLASDSSTNSMRLIESYAYHDLKLNADLSETDFDVLNPLYNFP